MIHRIFHRKEHAHVLLTNIPSMEILHLCPTYITPRLTHILHCMYFLFIQLGEITLMSGIKRKNVLIHFLFLLLCLQLLHKDLEQKSISFQIYLTLQYKHFSVSFHSSKFNFSYKLLSSINMQARDLYMSQCAFSTSKTIEYIVRVPTFKIYLNI